MIVTDGVFLQFLQNSLNSLRFSNGFYDVILQAESQQFHAHKAVLAAASPYFRAMFTARGFKEFGEEVVTLKMEPEILREILNFIYTCKIELSEENIYLLMSAVDLLEMTSLRICISKYLISTLSLDSCLITYAAASQLNYHDLAEAAFRFCAMNFELIPDNDEFENLSEDIVFEFISSKLLNVPDESFVLEAVLTWVSANPEKRKAHLPKLLSCVKLQHVSIDKLTLAKTYLAAVGELGFVRTIDEIIEELPDKTCTLYWPHSRTPRLDRTPRYHLDQEVLLAIGGESNGMATSNVECFTAGYKGWKCIIPEFVVVGEVETETRVIAPMRCARVDAAVAYDSRNTYIIGGQTSIMQLNTCEAYDVVINRWGQLPPLPAVLEGCAASLCDGRIIVTGGKGSNNVYELHPKKWLAWKPLPPLPQPRYNHCSVALHGFVYVLGGYTTSDQKPTASVLRYDARCQEWLELPNMTNSRAWFGSAVVNSTIFVMGGLDEENVLRSVEMYDAVSNQWHSLTDMPVPRYHFSVTISSHRIVCLGGKDSVHRLHTAVQYNPKTDHWHAFDSLQMARFGLGAATLRIPVLKNMSR